MTEADSPVFLFSLPLLLFAAVSNRFLLGVSLEIPSDWSLDHHFLCLSAWSLSMVQIRTLGK